MIQYLIKLLKTSICYFLIFLLFSILLTYILKKETTPITKTNAYRIFGILPLREMIGIPPISLLIWYIISTKYKRNINFCILLIESIIMMFITGFIIHYIFNIKSELGFLLGFLKKPDGTGLAPYSNYNI